MRGLTGYEIRDVDPFFDQNDEFLNNLHRQDPDAFDDFQESWSEWIANPEQKQFDSHPVEGGFGERGWILWRSHMNHKKLRLFFMVNHRRKEILPVRVRNDHDYHPHLMKTIARKGLGMAKCGDESQRASVLDRMSREISASCWTLFV